MRALAAMAAADAILLTGCSPAPAAADGTDRAPGDVAVHYVDLPDGRRVLCVSEQKVGASGVGLGISCEWQGAK
ncbi:hypothetical protein PBI_VALIDUS_72 [Mycobacterium phage Validus]|uniref:Uncharacterized protein n=1 Tax=Mycobacterium phage Validus TaxID=1414747 RepID=V5URP3_9CAUD|nr:HNH endonuclease [Mycobacterium phage Validus]AHB79602.1 hypothetical protein PBI_VALIDUS_72 [Mycobacterium phage Validus]